VVVNKLERYFKVHGLGDISMKFFKFTASLAISIAVGNATAATLNLTDVPLYLGASVKPNVMLMLDNSGSMKISMFGGGLGSLHTNFDPNASYFGMFDESKTYRYNSTIPVNPNGYNGSAAAPYNIIVDTTKTGAFYESVCNPSVDLDCWSGLYLNWLTTRRIDATREVLVGGKLESRTAYNYGTIGGTTYNYKVVAQNEYDDRDWRAQVSNSSLYSPIPDNQLHYVRSPAHQNSGNQLPAYDPYAKITLGAFAIRNSLGTQIGEAGSVSNVREKDQNGANNGWVSVSFTQSYTNPVVVARPPTFVGSAPGVVRIRNVTATGFEITFQEWEYIDDNSHSGETISYVVVESGTHTLPGSNQMVAGAVSTNAAITQANCSAGKVNNFATVNFASSFSGASPVVIASSNTINDVIASTVRVSNITTTNFRVSQQREEQQANVTPLSETIAYIAIQPGTITDVATNMTLEVGRVSNIDNTVDTITFANVLSDVPVFVANMVTTAGTDPANLRLNSLTNTTATLHVDEEASCDSETNHGNEDVGYFALWGSSGFNIALVKPDKPTGLLHDIAGDVRLGVSFYRFPPNKSDGSGIYNGVTTDGGTLQFKIPNNPFVKVPSASGGGGYRDLTGYITTPIDEVVDAVEHYPLVWGTTPLAENLWEVIQYFEQDDPHFTVSGIDDGFVKATQSSTADKKRDPYYYEEADAKLWCAKSSVILFTDGEPFRDNSSPSTILDYDGDGNAQDGQEHGDDLDDVAYWGFCDTSSGGGSCVGEPIGTRDLRSDIDGGSDDPGQFLRVHAVRFAGSSLNQIMIDTAANAGGNAYYAADGEQLETALTEAFQAAALESSAASVALNSGSIGSGSRIYQGRFDSGDWSGQLLAFPILEDATTGEVSVGSELWDAADLMPSASSRKIFTFDGTNAVPFQMADISAAMKAQLGPTVTEQTDVLNYLRGDQSKELDQPGGKYRTRETVLGDLINSPPILLAPPSARYPDNWGTGAAENAKPYSDFVAANSSRSELILVGANDGMLHAFNTSGVEQFAYIPNAVFSKLPELTMNSYSHKYFVDGPVNILDAFFNNVWNTVLVSGLGAGGQGLFALDLTTPSSYSSESSAVNEFLWEFTDSDDQDLGYTFSLPSIVRLYSGVSSTSNKWAAVFGNGYNNTEDNAGDGPTADSTTGNAVIYIVDIEDGSIIKKFDTGVGTADDPTGANRPNGMSSPAVVDSNNDTIADYIYAGDLFGNLWKIDISDSDIANWDFAYKSGSSPQPIFSACAVNSCTAPTTNAQAITTQPQVKEHPVLSGFLVYFGTGKYIETTDNSGTGQTTQTYYGIWDKAETTLTTFDRSDLLEQEIIAEDTVGGFDFRITSANSIDWNIHNGWYLDLIKSGSSNNYGERQVTNSIIRNGRIIFTTLIPDDDPCGNGGTGWLMELDQFSGSRLSQTPFDTNSDGEFTASDFVTITEGGVEKQVAVSGVKSQVGIITTPSIAEKDGTEYKFTSGSSGAIGVTSENPGIGVGGRQSWRQLDF